MWKIGKHFKALMAMLLLKNHLWATFQQQFQYSLTIKVFVYPLLQCWQIWHHRHFAGLSWCTKDKQQIFYIPTCNWNLRFFSIAVTAHIINKQRNQTVIIDHLKINCGQSKTAWNFSPDYKALGRKSLTSSGGGLQPWAHHPWIYTSWKLACEATFEMKHPQVFAMKTKISRL